MTKNLRLFFILSFFVILALYSPLIIKNEGNFVLASEVMLPGLGENPTLPQYISFIFNFVMQLAGILAVLAVAFGGLRYLVSFGSPTAKSAGMEWVKAGILGLLLLMCSYMILYTINKDLVSFKMTALGIPIPEINIPGNPKEPEISENTYVELPIGTLTENVLSKAINCYDFDLNGDPIDGKSETGDIYEPTLENHDRLDCALKIYEAAEKKAKISSLLSEEIAKLMETCDCNGKCDLTCKNCYYAGGGCPRDVSYIGKDTLCQGDCKGASCKNTNNKQCCPDTCIKDGNILNIDVSKEEGKKACAQSGGRIVGAKEIIENGPIKISSTCPGCNEKTYKGLSEFRTSLKEISSIIEKEITISDKKVKVIQKDKWNQLKIIEQLMYFKEKINKIEGDLKNDSDILKQAESQANACYLIKSAVDFWKIYEKNDDTANKKIIIKNYFIKDPLTDEEIIIDSSKYCKGYNYSDSSCFGFCRKMCFPTTSPKSFAGLKNCSANNLKCLEDNFYKCADNNFGFTNMQECLTGCRTECSKSCDIKYPPCKDKNKECKNTCAVILSNCLNGCDTRYPTDLNRKKACKTFCNNQASECPKNCDKNYVKCATDENKDCKDACNKDSEYILSQDENCFGEKFKSVKNCADSHDISDFESFKKCVELSTCSFCTDQYAGYPDCAKNIGQSSSLYLYKNPSQQKCQSCYQDIDPETGKIKYAGVEQYPECQKCPACSICPKCPCKNADCSQIEEKVLSCSAECAESVYNQDPLTFYCRNKWWEEASDATKGTNALNNSSDDTDIIKEIKEADDITQEEKNELLKEATLTTTILAKTLYCQKGEEIPVGETVDGTEAWVDDIIKFIDENPIKKLDDIINYIKQIGDETSYCECNSKCSATESICQSSCVFGQVEITNPETGAKSWVCSCYTTPCAGNPCKKIINLLRGKKKEDSCPKDTEYKGVAWYKQEITKSFEEFKKAVLQGERPDLLKKLVYSRKKMSECGVASNIYEKEKSTISCTIAKDYLITPVLDWSVIINNKKFNNQCYGGWLLSKIVGDELMNNWECCEIWQK